MSLHKFYKVLSTTAYYVRKCGHLEKSEGGKLSQQSLAKNIHGWSHDLLNLLNVDLVKRGEPIMKEPGLFLGNHISYLDIPAIMSQTPTSFVAKQELSRWPVFGRACRTAGIVFVKRESARSRGEVAPAIATATQQNKQSVTLFPSGTTTMFEERPWRWGAFVIAKELGIPVQPFRLRYSPLRRCAYVLADNFVWHLIELLEQPKIHACIDFGEPFYVKDPNVDALRCWNWSRDEIPVWTSKEGIPHYI